LCAVAFGFTPWSSGATELLIALSVVLLAAETWGGLPAKVPSKMSLAMLVGGVGLIHGLGFGGVLLELGSTREGALRTLLGFNVGIEFGQLALCIGWLGAEYAVGNMSTNASSILRRVVNICAGSFGAFWTLDRAIGWVSGIS